MRKEFCFYGSGILGPRIVMTDNSDELRDALLSVWPNIILVLCILLHRMVVRRLKFGFAFCCSFFFAPYRSFNEI